MNGNILSVSEITSQIKIVLEKEFSQISVVGEISNFKKHVSGHWYFTLKDANSQINCTMWRGMNSYVFFSPSDGMKVIVTGRMNIYPVRGSYQIDVRSMKPAGEGELQAAFQRLKQKLADEGLFDENIKKSIVKFPKKIGIATASDGAALRDMINIAQRRYPLLEIVVIPCTVQGEKCAGDIARAIKILNRMKDVDTIIVGRGGGSLEDLWGFNEEEVARAIFSSTTPIISGVGHEVDFTIADFAADLRAPTPSAAMELATPNIDEIFAFIDEFSYYTTNNISKLISKNREIIKNLIKSYGFRIPKNLIKNNFQTLDNLFYKISNQIESGVLRNKNKLSLLTKTLEGFDQNKILKRGFTIIKQNDKVIQRADFFNTDKNFAIKFFDNEIKIDNE